MVGCKFLMRKQNSDWINTLLQTEFFGLCVKHTELRKNEENVFCIDCCCSFCKHCINAHSVHKHFQICKYVYHDVVRLNELHKHLDCSKIQTYKINGEKAVHLNPRPQAKDAKPSTKAKFGAACQACGRYLQDIPNSFCSIACKLTIVPMKPKDEFTFSIQDFSDMSWKENGKDNPKIDAKELTQLSTSTSDDVSNETQSSGLKRKRKGVPHRAPFR